MFKMKLHNGELLREPVSIISDIIGMEFLSKSTSDNVILNVILISDYISVELCSTSY